MILISPRTCCLSGIKRALENWPAIDFVDDREGSLFIVTIHRRAIDDSEKTSEKTSEKILELLREQPTASARTLAGIVGLSPHVVERRLAALRNAGRIRRIGPDKGGHGEVLDSAV
jgi:ATP-dependent DNA helicase RecG